MRCPPSPPSTPLCASMDISLHPDHKRALQIIHHIGIQNSLQNLGEFSIKKTKKTKLLISVFENKEKMVLVMEIAAGGELYDYLSEKKCLEELEAKRIFRQIATAVYYCHKNNICHRDLKLENILLDENGNAKVRLFVIVHTALAGYYNSSTGL